MHAVSENRDTSRQARRRGLQNKRILNAKQREWIICSPNSILNILPRSVNNATLSTITSAGRRELTDMCGSLLEETSSILENREGESESHDFEEVRSSI